MNQSPRFAGAGKSKSLDAVVKKIAPRPAPKPIPVQRVVRHALAAATKKK
jgi:hypothetical protein